MDQATSEADTRRGSPTATNRSAGFLQRELERLKAVIPSQIAHEQVSWALDQRLLRLYRNGVYVTELGRLLGLLGVRANTVDRRIKRAKAREGRRSPIERYLADNSDVLELTAASLPAQSLPPFLKPWTRG